MSFPVILHFTTVTRVGIIKVLEYWICIYTELKSCKVVQLHLFFFILGMCQKRSSWCKCVKQNCDRSCMTQQRLAFVLAVRDNKLCDCNNNWNGSINVSEVCYNKFSEHLVQVRAVHLLCTVIAGDRTCVSDVQSGGTNAVLNWKDLPITLVAPCWACIKLNCLDAVTFLYLEYLARRDRKINRAGTLCLASNATYFMFIYYSLCVWYCKHNFNNQLNHPYVYCNYLY